MKRTPRRTTATAVALMVAAAMALTGCNSAAPSNQTASDESGEVTIGIGGQTLLSYLPTTLAQQLGYYEDEGLDVKLQDLQSGSDALTGMIGGSTDVTCGYYEHTIQMQAKNQDIKSFVTMLKLPGLVLAASPGNSDEIDSVKDLEGKTVGVTSPGSSTDFFLKYLLSKAGMDPNSVSVTPIGSGATAVAAMENDKVSAAVMLDPAVSQLEKRAGDLKILSDLRTEQGAQDVYGVTSYPAAVLYTKTAFLDKNPETAQKLTHAITRTLDWISQHSGEEIAAKMPEQYAAGDAELYARAIDNAKPTFTRDGLMPADGPQAVLDTQETSNPEVKGHDIDLDATYTNEFVEN